MFTGWLILFGAHLLYSSNMTLSFLLWGLSGLLVAQAALAVKETDFGRSPRMGLVFSFAFVVVAVGVLATLFITGGRYRAEVAFAKAVELDRAGAPISEVVAQTSLAVSYNRYADVYYRNLSSALLVQARKEAAALTGEMTVEQRQTISNLVASAVNAAKRATDIEPNNVSNWSVRGAIYRDVMSFVQNAEDFAAATYEQAIALEPNSPAHYVNLGRVHLLVADRARALKRAENAELAATAAKSETEQLDAAEAAFLKAIELKRDYAPAHYYLAAAYERQGRLADAVSRLAALRAARPLDVGLGFQLSMLYIRTQNFDKAQAELESVIATSPNYSNALWFLASLYELDGDLAKATDMVEKVAELNPGNKLVAERLERLRSGQATTAIPGPVEEGEESATSVEEGEVEEEEPAADEEGNVEADTGNE
jgi:tetratricopeptide (TPR) repeat protein